jgi:hypothetical protein
MSLAGKFRTLRSLAGGITTPDQLLEMLSQAGVEVSYSALPVSGQPLKAALQAMVARGQGGAAFYQVSAEVAQGTLFAFVVLQEKKVDVLYKKCLTPPVVRAKVASQDAELLEVASVSQNI